MNLLEIKKVYNLMKLLANKKVFNLIVYLKTQNDISVTEIINHTGFSQSETSQILSRLKKRGLVKFKKDKKFVFYTLNVERLEAVHKIILELINKVTIPSRS